MKKLVHISTTVSLTAGPGANSTFAGWGGNCAGTGACSVILNSTQVVSAIFNTSGGGMFTLTISSNGAGGGNVTSTPAGINCGGPGATMCSAAFSTGTVVNLTATPSTTSAFGGWAGGGCTAAATCSVMMNQPTSISATFNPGGTSFPLTIGLSGTGPGNVTGSPGGINCGNGGTICSANYAGNTTVTLTAAGTAGSTFSSWTGAAGCTTSTVCNVTVNSAQNVTASFNSSGVTLTISNGGVGAGNVTSSPAGINCGNGFTSCSAIFPMNTIVVLTAASGAGATFGGWSGGGCSGIGTCSVTLAASMNLGAIFNSLSYNLTVSTVGAGVGNVTSAPAGINCGNGGFSCNVGFSSNTPVTLTAAPGAGSVFSGWSGGGCAGTGSCVVTISASQFVTAFFDPSSGGVFGLNVNVTGIGNVTGAPAGINCGNGGVNCFANYPTATIVNLVASPAPGYTFTGWTGAGCVGVGPCNVTMNTAQYVTATFSPTSLNLTVSNTGSGAGSIVSNPAGINCGNGAVACSISFSSNTIINLSALPNSGSIFSGWAGAGCTGTGACQVTMSGSQAVSANFTVSSTATGSGFVLTVTNTGSGNITSTPAGINCGNGGTTCSYSSFPPSTPVTLTATSGSGATFAGWGGGGCTGVGSCTVTMSVNQFISATFNTPVLLTISNTGSGAGNVVSAPAGINCGNGGTACSVGFNSNMIVNLTAGAAAGSVFAGWSGGGCTGTGPCSVTMAAAQNVTATFNILGSGFPLTVSQAGTGSGYIGSAPTGIDCGTNCTATYPSATVVTLTASAGPNSIFGGWSGGGCAGLGTCSVTLSAAQNVIATFNPSGGGFLLTVANSGTGLGNVISSPPGINCGNGGAVCSLAFAPNTSVTLTAAPAAGNSFAGWNIPGCTGTASCTVNMTAAQNVSAAFTGVASVSGTISYGGTQFGPVRVEFWSNSGFTDQLIGVAILPTGAGAYNISVPGGSFFYVRAFMDLNNNFIPDPNEPFGFYSPTGQGPSPLTMPVAGSLPGVNLTIKDPTGSSGSQAGEGVASLNVSSVSAGSMFNLAVTYASLSGGIQTGGKIGVILPPGFYPGSVVTASTSAATLSPITYSGPALFTTVGGNLLPGQNVVFTFNNLFAPCMNSTQTFTVASSQNGSVAQPQPLFSGSPVLNIAAGSASNFQFVNGYFSTKQGILSDPQTIVARDSCGNAASVLGAPQTLALRGKVYNIAGGFADDLSIGFNTVAVNPSMGPANVTFAVGQSSQTVYVLANSSGAKNIEMFSTLNGPTTFYTGFTVLNGNPLTNVSVSTAAFLLGQTVATIVANGDPTVASLAFINFNLTDPTQSWHVLVSSIPLAAGVTPTGVWERWGTGQPGPGMISWDGRYLPWINGGIRVPAGTYYVRVELGVGGVHDDSLSIIVNTPQLAGQVLDLGSNPHLPLANANVSIYGPFGGGAVQSNSAGSYVFPGLGAGSYNLFLTRDTYLDSSANFTLDNTGKVSTFTALTNSVVISSNASGGLDFLMTRAPVLFVVPAAGVGFSTSTTDRWGSLQLQGSNSQTPIFGALHVAAGTTTFDDGGQWNPGTQSFVVSTFLKFKVAVDTYTVQATFPGFAVSSGTIFVPPNGTTLNLPAFASKGSLSGTVTVPLNPAGMFVSVNAISTSSGTAAAGGFGGVYLNPGITVGTYIINNLDAGSYLLNGNAPGFTGVTAGPVAVPAATAVTLNLPTFASGASITGAAKINVNTTGSLLQLSINAWAPGAFSFGSTVVYQAGGASGMTIPYQISGLIGGTTYQIYAQLSGAGNLNVLEGMPLSGVAPSAVNFTYAQSSGVIAGTINLPAGAVDFGQVDMYGQVVTSVRPERVGTTFSVIASTNLPGFTCTSTGLGAPSGSCPAGNNAATFRITGLDTETDDITFFYKTTGQISKTRVSVVNGSTSALTVSLAAQTYSISGSIINQISNSLFNTNANIFANAPEVPLLDVNGNPAALSTIGVARSTASLARVIAVQQDINNYNAAISTSFNPATSYVGFITAAGTFTIANVPSGIYAVRTTNLRACATCPTLVPSVSQIIAVTGANKTGVNFTLSDGFSIAGTISLDGAVQDADVYTVSVLNRRQEVVRSTTVYLGDLNMGLAANSVNYSFSNIPANDFYTLTVVGQLSTPKYAGQPIKFPDPALSPTGLQSSLVGQNVVMQRAAYIIGRMLDSNTGALINPNNAALLAPNFGISAKSNPWVQGGFAVAASSVSGRPIQADGYFRVGPLLPKIAYDLTLAQTSWDPAFLAQGSQNYAPVTLSGITPQSGEFHDVGVVSLSQGQSISGTVRQSTTTGVALGNIKIVAKPSFGEATLTVQTYTNPQGKYTVWVSSAVSREYDITAAPVDGNLSSNGLAYGQVTLRNINLQATATADFLLTPLTQSVTGQVVVFDAAGGGTLSYPFGASKGFPVAAINLQPAGVVPTQNPLGDIQIVTDQSGNFQVTGLSTGTYTLKATSLGYSVFNATVTTTATSCRIYTGVDTPANYLPGNILTLQRGAILTGRLLKADGTAPNDGEVGGIAAANFASGEYIVGSVDIDPTAKTVNSYSISGFKTGINYTVVVLPSDSLDGLVFPPEGAAVNFSVSETTSAKNIDLTYLIQSLDCQATSKSLGNSQFQIKIDCSKSMRNTLTADNDLNRILVVSTVTSAGVTLGSPNSTGQLLGSDKAMSSNRRTITAIYRAVANETNFSLRLRVYAAAVDPHTGGNFYVDKTFDFYTGLTSHVSQKVSNINGGSVELVPTAGDEASGLSERAQIDLQAGSFAEGINDASAIVVASETITLGISKGQDQTLAKTLALKTQGYIPASLDILANMDAFPPEMAAAMKMYRGLASSTGAVGGVNPLSSFYSIFLPAGIRHQLKKSADLTLSYSLITNSSQDPNAINIWYYNPALGKYVQEAANRRLDTVNKTITVSVDHFSTFVVLGSTPIFTSTGTFTGNDIQVYNFPNPSDCIQHTSQLLNSIGANPNLTYQGTMVRFALPGGSGDVSEAKLNIYNMAGELVRDMNMGVLPGGTVQYNNWDCKNDSGRTVASGVYIGQLKWNNRSKFFKMAIIRGSGL